MSNKNGSNSAARGKNAYLEQLDSVIDSTPGIGPEDIADAQPAGAHVPSGDRNWKPGEPSVAGSDYGDQVEGY